MIFVKDSHRKEIERIEKAYAEKLENDRASLKRHHEYNVAPKYKISTSYDVKTNSDVHHIIEKQQHYAGLYFYAYGLDQNSGPNYQSIYSGTKQECEVRLKRLLKNQEAN